MFQSGARVVYFCTLLGIGALFWGFVGYWWK
jgi:hypothetical protein